MSYSVAGFIFLLVGLGLFTWTLCHLVQALANGFQDEADVLDAAFVIVCIPLLYDFFISGFRVDTLERFLYITAAIGFLSLIVIVIQFAMLKVKEDSFSDKLIALFVVVGFAFFVLWRFYDIVMVRENFWVLLVLFFGGFGAYLASLNNTPNNSTQVLPPENEPPPYIPPQQTLPQTEDLSRIDPRDAFDIPPQRLDE